MSNQTILVTGASSGFGERIAEALVRRGHTVYGTSRRDLPDTASGVKMRRLDVTRPQSVQACVQTVLDEAGSLDVLVNNAGRGQIGLAEETDIDSAQALMNVNFWGMVRMTHAVLPHMRERGAGQLIYTGSLAGLIGPPGQAFYSASKHALEGYAEALHLEVEQFGVQVSILEPGFFNTGLHGSALEETAPIADYDNLRDSLKTQLTEAIQTGGDPDEVARQVVQIVEDDSPALRYRIGDDARWVPRLKKFMPEAMFEFGFRRRFGLHELDSDD